ncbi:MAG: C25 family cysteine peptidase, partial [Bacteroidota bacterium]
GFGFNIEYQQVYTGDPTLTPTLEIKIVGEFESTNRYQTEISIGPSGGTLRALPSLHQAVSHGTSTITHPLNYTDLNGGADLRVRVFAQIGDVRMVYARLRYPQQWQSSGTGDEVFGLIPKSFGDTSRVNINNVNALQGLYDISDPNNVVKLGYNLNTGTLETYVPHAQSLLNGAFTRNILLNRESARVPHRFEAIRFENYNPDLYDYLIVSHPLLRQPTGPYNDPVQAYADYRASPNGGNHRVLLADIDQLFNQFTFGERTPLAIRRFARFMYNNNPETAFLFLIGKAASFPDNYLPVGDPNFIDIRTDTLSSRVNLVPTLGFPPSDIAMVSGLSDNSKRPAVPDIAVGRIPAFRPDQVATYLDKVIDHESEKLALWQKNIIHLGGGNNEIEQRLFRGYLDEFAETAENSLMGAQVSTTGKSTTSPIETVNISEQVNEGVGLITFFGHSALDITDIEIGNVSDDIQG